MITVLADSMELTVRAPVGVAVVTGPATRPYIRFNPWTTTVPFTIPGTHAEAPVTSVRLLENGDFRLIETGDGRLLETDPAVSFPSYPSGLVGWWDASDTATITESGGAVSQWDDKTASGTDLVQATGAAKPATGGDINGLNALTFDGGDVLTFTGDAGIPADNATVFAVVNQSAVGVLPGIFVRYAAGTVNDTADQKAWVLRAGNMDGDVGMERITYFTKAEVQGVGAIPTSVVVGRIDDTYMIEAYKNGGTAGIGRTNVGVMTGASAGLIVGGRWVSSAVDASFRWAGEIGEIVVYDRCLTVAELDFVGGYLADKWGTSWTAVEPAPFLIWEGDSLTASSMPNLVYVDNDAVHYYATATGGETLADMITQAAAEVDAYYRPGQANILSIWAGTNDMHFDATGADTYAAYADYCLDRQAAGFQVLAWTVLPRTDDAQFEIDRQAFNTLVRANWTDFADALVDPAADTNIGDAGDNLDTTYYTDGTHMTTAGYQIVADLVNAELAALGYS